MFPIRDHNPSDRRPYVTWALLAVNIIIFLSYFPAMGSDSAAQLSFYRDWGLVPAEVLGGDHGYALVTHMFLHGGWMHLIGNMVFLYIFGDNLEDLMGHLGFAVFYLASGFAAAAGQIAADPASVVPMVGASGAIAGVMGGYLLLFPRARIDVLVILFIFIRIFTIPAWLLLSLWFGLQVVSGLSADLLGGGVAYWAHAGGFVAGVVLALPLWRRLGGAAFWDRFDGKPPHPEVEYQVKRQSGSGIPRVSRIQTVRADRPLADLGRIPRSGSRRGPKGPWSGGR